MTPESARRIQLRPMSPDDWPEASAIYRQEIAGGEATFETSLPAWPDWDQTYLAAPRLIAVEGGRVVGWAALSPVSRRSAYAGVAEVSVYVAADARGRGIGTSLLGELVRQSEAAGIWTLQASTFPENRASLELQKRHGFHEIGRPERIGQCRGVWRDTILTERRSRVVGV